MPRDGRQPGLGLQQNGEDGSPRQHGPLPRHDGRPQHAQAGAMQRRPQPTVDHGDKIQVAGLSRRGPYVKEAWGEKSLDQWGLEGSWPRLKRYFGLRSRRSRNDRPRSVVPCGVADLGLGMLYAYIPHLKRDTF